MRLLGFLFTNKVDNLDVFYINVVNMVFEIKLPINLVF